MNNYAVYKVFRDWNKKTKMLIPNLTREQAQTIVQNTPSEPDSMIVFDKMKLFVYGQARTKIPRRITTSGCNTSTVKSELISNVN